MHGEGHHVHHLLLPSVYNTSPALPPTLAIPRLRGVALTQLMEAAWAQAHPGMIATIPGGGGSFSIGHVERRVQHGGFPFSVVHGRQGYLLSARPGYTAFGGKLAKLSFLPACLKRFYSCKSCIIWAAGFFSARGAKFLLQHPLSPCQYSVLIGLDEMSGVGGCCRLLDLRVILPARRAATETIRDAFMTGIDSLPAEFL
jgi:hypothetical protein